MKISPIPFWFPSCKDEDQRDLALLLTQNIYRLIIPDKESSLISFCKNGLVGIGNDEEKKHWDIIRYGERSYLEIYSSTSRLYSLVCNSNKWEGYSMNNAEDAVILVPLKESQKYYAFAFKMNGNGIISNYNCIHVQLSGQLGNCLRNISTIKILADSLGYNWDIDLSKSNSPNATIQVIEKLFPDKIKYYPEGTYIDFSELKLMTFFDIYGTNSHPIVEAIIDRFPAFEFGAKHIYSARPSTMSNEIYLKNKLQFYAEIDWPIEILREVEEFIRSHCSGDLSNFIGIHIRHTDNFQDYLKTTLKLNTSLEIFIEKLRSLGNESILICTDNPEVRKRIESEFPDLRIVFPTTVDSLYQPLFEMYLLSQTKYIIGSYSSTFSYEASFIKGNNLELYTGGNWIRYNICQR
ncbi:hypothetical protein FFJ24_005780 [Pedobacter sp. KBS0701]|uniref:hypothetical protein n=1 Tax=Pedobacter sp. KBS0701 TaxID=2578106 RepID=UPI00110F5DB0|nr:hypothetical protein [Pedobacter sp. KBS0701]QDW24359.1 hypothetical protein FFJ24_005780 [Pedobacter sp. KBS0701]